MKFTHASGDRPLAGYTVQHGIGRGGFGEVYQAISDGGKEVALKLVQRNLEVELRGVSQCLNLKHPNLVAVYDVKQAENGDCWIVMEHVAGDTLDHVIARYPDGMPQEQVLLWLRGVCAGVGYLHEQGIVHRDLKPGNIFLEGGTVKIGDYGLSKFISASRRSGQTGSVGTVHYMAPEVVNGRYGKEVDLYALGVILYEMLTGRVPLDGESPGEILMKHLTVTPDLNAVPPAFRAVVARLLDKAPQRRYSSVQAMLADLDGYVKGGVADEAWPSEPAWPPVPSGPPPAGPDRWSSGVTVAGVHLPGSVRVALCFAISFLIAVGAGLVIWGALSSEPGVMMDPYRYPAMMRMVWGDGLLIFAVLLPASLWLSGFHARRQQAARERLAAGKHVGLITRAKRVLLSLTLAAGVGLFMGGIMHSTSRREEVAFLIAFGSGLVTLAVVILFGWPRLGWSENAPSATFAETHHPPVTPSSGVPLQQTGPWHPTSQT